MWSWRNRVEGVFLRFAMRRSYLMADSYRGFLQTVQHEKRVRFCWISPNLIKLDQNVFGVQVVGLVLSTLQVLGLNCFRGARCGIKTYIRLEKLAIFFPKSNWNGWSGIYRSMQELEWHFSKFRNCSGIFQNHMNWSGIYPINPNNKFWTIRVRLRPLATNIPICRSKMLPNANGRIHLVSVTARQHCAKRINWHGTWSAVPVTAETTPGTTSKEQRTGYVCATAVVIKLNYNSRWRNRFYQNRICLRNLPAMISPVQVIINEN
jgi:hypothetical protein